MIFFSYLLLIGILIFRIFIVHLVGLYFFFSVEFFLSFFAITRDFKCSLTTLHCSPNCKSFLSQYFL